MKSGYIKFKGHKIRKLTYFDMLELNEPVIEVNKSLFKKEIVKRKPTELEIAKRIVNVIFKNSEPNLNINSIEFGDANKILEKLSCFDSFKDKPKKVKKNVN